MCECCLEDGGGAGPGGGEGGRGRGREWEGASGEGGQVGEGRGHGEERWGRGSGGAEGGASAENPQGASRRFLRGLWPRAREQGILYHHPFSLNVTAVLKGVPAGRVTEAAFVAPAPDLKTARSHTEAPERPLSGPRWRGERRGQAASPRTRRQALLASLRRGG